MAKMPNVWLRQAGKRSQSKYKGVNRPCLQPMVKHKSIHRSAIPQPMRDFALLSEKALRGSITQTSAAYPAQGGKAEHDSTKQNHPEGYYRKGAQLFPHLAEQLEEHSHRFFMVRLHIVGLDA